MSLAAYKSAVKLGKKEFQSRIINGQVPVLPVLDEILPGNIKLAEVSLGLQSLPLDLVVGTKTGGRSNAFASNFMPILDDDSEFASKWIELSTAHVEEGIRDPIKAYEYMHKYYVQEGNKRVSVLKFYGAKEVDAMVTRIIPPRTSDPENRLYFEYLDFYQNAPLNNIWFSKQGSWKRLQMAVAGEPEKAWDEDMLMDFRSSFLRFEEAYAKNGGNELSVSSADAYLNFMELHGFDLVRHLSAAEMEEFVAGSFQEFQLLANDNPVDLRLEPDVIKVPLLKRVLSSGISKITVAFFYADSPSNSAWTYAHEMGRLYLNDRYPDEIETLVYENVTSENIREYFEDARDKGARIFFTTFMGMEAASLKAGMFFDDVYVLNCALNMQHRYIRSYYVRTHEPKFIIGAVAGSLAENDRIVYFADHLYYGSIANINAFALGVSLTNPRAKVHLLWPEHMTEQQIMDTLREIDPSCISGRDFADPNHPSRNFGLFTFRDNSITSLITPFWNWGKFYAELIRSIADGSVKYEKDSPDQAVNYWWGMSAGVNDVIYSNRLPQGTKRLIELLKSNIKSKDFNPFSGVLYSQKGIVQRNPEGILSPEAISKMDWLCANVVGEIIWERPDMKSEDEGNS